MLDFLLASVNAADEPSSNDAAEIIDIGYGTPADLAPFDQSNVKIGECPVCKVLVKVVKEIVKHSLNREHVKNALKKACRKVHVRGCQRFLDRHFNQLVDLLSKASTRGRVCKIMRVCSHLDAVEDGDDYSLEIDDYTSQDYDLTPFEASNVKIGECPVCRVLVKVVKEIVKHSLNREHVKNALKKACRKVHVRGCQRFLDRHFNQLVDLLSKASTRGRVCKIMRVCSHFDGVEDGDDYSLEIDDYTSLDYDIESFEQSNVKIGECPVCRALVKVVKEIVKHSLNREQVKRALKKACSKVHSRRCQRFLDRHFNQLVDLLSKASTRGRVCKIMRVCSHLDAVEDDDDDYSLEIEDTSQDYVLSVI